MLTRAIVLPVALVVVASIALVGCSGAAKPTSSDPATLNCTDFVKFSTDERNAIAQQLQVATFLSFDADGVSDIAPGDYLTTTCASAQADTQVGQIATQAAQTFPPCAEFVVLDPTVQESWAKPVLDYFPSIVIPAVDNVPALVAGCTATEVINPDLQDAAEAFAIYWAGTSGSDPVPSDSRLSENVSITDRDGYTFDVAVGYSMTSVTNDPSAEKPGFTSALLNVAIDLTLKNTTGSRDISFANENGTVAPLSYPSLTLVAVYAADSAVCAAQYPGQSCAFSPGFGRWNSTLPQNGTLPLEVYAGLRNGTGAAGVAQIPEAQFADVQAALATPSGYLIIYRGGDNQRFTSVCPSETSPWGVAIAAIGNACIGSITLQQPTGG